VVAGNPSVTRQTAQTRGVRTADPDPQLFLRIDQNKSIKMSGKLAVGVAKDSQIFSEHQGASRGHLCDSMASCFISLDGTSRWRIATVILNFDLHF